MRTLILMIASSGWTMLCEALELAIDESMRLTGE